MRTLNEFQNSGIGKTCAILGGGPTLPADMRAIPSVDVLIGVNQHSLIAPLDFVVFSDAPMWESLKDYPDIMKITILGNWYDRDDVILMDGFLKIGFSGAKAVIAADYMGFDTIYVCGMDNYSPRDDGREYWWQPAGNQAKPTHNHCNNLDAWIKVRDSLRRPHAVKFVSGRLREIFDAD